MKVLEESKRPKKLSELRGFIALLQCFRRFIKYFSHVASPLTELSKKGMGMKEWNEHCEEALNNMQGALIKDTIFVSADWTKQCRCYVDASQRAVGGTLTKLDENGTDRVVAYFSRKI